MRKMLLAAVALAALTSVAMAQQSQTVPGTLPAPTVGLDQVPAPAPNAGNQANSELITQAVQVSGGTLYVSTLYQGTANGGNGQPVSSTSTFVPTPQLGLRLGSPQLKQWSVACQCFLAPLN